MTANPAGHNQSAAPAPAQFSHEADVRASPVNRGAAAADGAHDYLGSPFTPEGAASH